MVVKIYLKCMFNPQLKNFLTIWGQRSHISNFLASGKLALGVLNHDFLAFGALNFGKMTFRVSVSDFCPVILN